MGGPYGGNGDDDWDIDERTGDFKLFSEVYGYEREHAHESDSDDGDDSDGDFDE